MRAVAVRQFRAPPELMELPRPDPAPGEIRIRIEAAGVNPLDWKILDGFYEGKRPHVFPLVAGVDGAGVVDAPDPAGGSFREGERVFGHLLHVPVGTGTYAEYATAASAGAIAPVPEGLSSDRAAALPTAGMTALEALERLDLKAGERLLIVGAAGGVGSIALQLARARGAHVHAVSRAANEPQLRRWGAEGVVASDRGNPHTELDAPSAVPFDALLDLVSAPAPFERYTRHLRPQGRAASTIGSASAPTPLGRGVRAVPVDLAPRAELLERLAAAAVTGKLDVPVQRRRPLEDGPAALAESRAGRSVGKTILDPAMPTDPAASPPGARAP